MAKYRLSPNAQRSLTNIKGYTSENYGSRQATRYLKQLRDRMRDLANNPRHGVKRDDIASGYHCYFEGSHTIYYLEMGPDGISIIDVLHQSMDPGRHLVQKPVPGSE